MSHHILLIVHLLAAAVWVGGHLYLVTCILPRVLKTKQPKSLLQFESSFEPLGIFALGLLVITGFWMTFQFGISFLDLFSFSHPVERVVSLKLILLILTVLLGLSAQFSIIPSLRKSPKKLNKMAIHAILVTLIGIALLILGSFVRYGGL